ncbi:hypothetical protein D9758_013651 [Tetrapyrgos nigripes]|uniref:Terpenoid synthase n=1 Tax=Tetrapyrgos nigripes TaxID=182062 RepID=A0A8H5FQ37_9AGAR|nr:hypothetical protein D9758_013651 [Tetrapyrgos nigripes]
MGLPEITQVWLQSNFSEVQAIYRSFLNRAGFTYPGPCTDADSKLYKLAIEESIRRSIPYPEYVTNANEDFPNRKKLKAYFGPILFSGVQITTTAYGHLDASPHLQMIVALFTAFAIYMDEAHQLGADAQEDVDRFQERFLSGERHTDPVLQAGDVLLKEMYQYFGRIQANCITAAALNMSTSVILESTKIEVTEPSYAEFYRRMSGVTDAYSLFIFPSNRNINLSDFIQTVPEIGVFLNHTNDILSFYKEEIAGEDVNYISLLAKSQGISKIDSLRLAVEKVILAHENIIRVLGCNKEALDCYRSFSQGYMAYHVYGERYKLNELGF